MTVRISPWDGGPTAQFRLRRLIVITMSFLYRRGDGVLAVLVVDGPDARGRPTLMGTLAAPGARRSEKKSSLHLYRHTGLRTAFALC